MLATNKIQSYVSILNRKDEEETNNKTPLLEKINSIKNINNNEAMGDDIAIDVQLGKKHGDTIGNGITVPSPVISSSGKVNWGKSVINWGTKIITLMAGLLGGGAIGYYLRYGNTGDQVNNWRLALSADEQQELREILTIIDNETLGNFLLDAPPKMRFTEALIRTIAHIRLMDNMSDASLRPVGADKDLVFPSITQTSSQGLSLQDFLKMDLPDSLLGAGTKNSLIVPKKDKGYWPNNHNRNEVDRQVKDRVRVRRERERANGIAMAMDCLFNKTYFDYWMNMFNLRQKFALLNLDLIKNTFRTHYPLIYDTPGDYNNGNGMSLVQGNPKERNPWLHTYGLSLEFPKLSENLTTNLIDTILSDMIYRKYGLTLTTQQLSRNIVVDIVYKGNPEDENEPLKYIYNNVYTIRKLFLKERAKFFFEMDESGKKQYTILETLIRGSTEENLLSYIEFIINGQSPDITDEIYHLLQFINASQDIDDAYIAMAKNRLVSALLPVMDNSLYHDVKDIIKNWLDGSLNEKLVSITTREERFIAPGIIAITESTAGLLISLATGAIYLWTPIDTSNELKKFISVHLSVRQQAWFKAAILTPYLDTETCILSPAITLTSSSDIWRDLKKLDFEKLDEHLDYHYLSFSGPEKKNPDPVVQQRLLAAGSAISQLAFFISGGSPAGCAAMMMGNLMLGAASSVLDIRSAIDAQDSRRRGEAWESALLGIIITGLGGAADMYSVVRAAGSQGYDLIHDASVAIRNAFTAGSGGSGQAETFIKGEARERSVMLVEGLLRDTNTRFDMFGENSVEAMLKVLRICGRIDTEKFRHPIENVDIDNILSQKTPVGLNKELSLIPAGYEIAIKDNETRQFVFLLLCLGNNRFAGYNIQELDRTLNCLPGWRVVDNDFFTFDNNKLLLRNGKTASAYVDGFQTAPLPIKWAELTSHEGQIATKFRRYCNFLKYHDGVNNILNGVERFAFNNGFDDIRYRALFIFDPVQESPNIRHYVLVARRNNINYVFEPNAEYIRFVKLPDVEDVAILTEKKWNESFKNSESRSLITYKDFPTEQTAKNYKPNYTINGDREKLLLSPPGFVELMEPSTPIIYSMFMSHYHGAEQQLLLQKKVRSNIAKNQTFENSYEFILSILKDMGAITHEHQTLLQNLYRENPHNILRKMISAPLPVTSFNDMLRIEPGRLVRFTDIEDNSNSHIMICMGNGRFAGMNNNVLDIELRDEKSILIAEQLGVFKEGILFSYVQKNGFRVEKGDFETLKMTHKSLMAIAQNLEGKATNEKNSIRFALEMLVDGKQLVPQQADALERLATLMVSKLDGDRLSTIKLNKFLAIDKYINNNAELERVPAGKLVVFYTEDKDFHPLVSLGNNRFASANNHLINNEINPDKIIISSREIGDIVNGRRLNNQKSFKVVLGDVNLEKTRISALLGPDGRIEYVRHGLNNLQMEIKAHGALASINHYDAIELSDIINGIHRSLYPDLPISHIELISCFGALGGRRSSAQVISNRLGATVESYRGIISDSKSRKRGSGVKFMPQAGYGIARNRENERWHRRIHNFIEDALSLFGHLPFQRHSRAISENIPFAMVVIDILHFLRKEISAQTLLRHYPGLMSEESLRQASFLANPTSNEEVLIAAILTIFYGNSNITNAMDAYVLSSEYKNQASGPVVVNGENLRQPLFWQDIVPSLTTFRQLPPVIVENDLLSGSNIFISLEDDKSSLKEYMIRVGSECNIKNLWPLLLANFFREQSASFPIVVGLQEHDILSMGFDFTHFHFYLNSWFRNDFSLQIDMTAAVSSPESFLPANYVHFSGGRRKTDTREDIGLGHSLLLEQDGWLALHVKEPLTIGRPAAPGDNGQAVDGVSPLPSMPRVVMTLVENDERFIMLQRNIPRKILSNDGEIAFFIAEEINKYTQSIKIGIKNNPEAKNSGDILPIKSNAANFVYSDPEALQKSWILINMIHND